MSKINKENKQVKSSKIEVTILDGANVSKAETTIEKAVRDRAASGFNINQIASQLGIHSQLVKEILDENL